MSRTGSQRRVSGYPVPNHQLTGRKPPIVMVVSAPSGAGKSTICGELLDRHDDMVFSVSTTTRPPRQHEIDGEDYHFVSDETFDRMVEEEAFLEWAEVHGHRYGTSRDAVRNELRARNDVMLDIDVQGGRQVSELFPEAVMVFLAPPSLEELERRLRNRGTETEQEINRRLANARKELQQMDDYDYLVVNDQIDQAVEEVECIRQAEKNRMSRDHEPFRRL